MTADAMDEIWQSIAREKDGKRCIIYKNVGDLATLYVGGFVDVIQYKFKEWVEAFKSSRQADGSYLVTYPQWIEKKKFRYSGPIGEPFDPLTLADAELTEEEFIKFLVQIIIPHTTLVAETVLPQIWTNTQKMGLFKNGKVLFNEECKRGLLFLMNNFPSPLRVQQILVDRIRNGGRRPINANDAQKSGFISGISAEKTITTRFSEIAKELKKENLEIDANAPVFSIKELKKRTPGRI